MPTNYFKVSDQFFFFNDKDMDDTVRAFDLALAAGTDLAVFKVPVVMGPWDKIGVVGYRLRAVILRELSLTTDTERLLFLQEELEHLDNAFVVAGRSESAVAA